MKKHLTILIAFCSLLSILAQAQNENAGTILKAAEQQAGAEHKNVIVIFHASWCIWCHRMDTAMNDPACKEYFKKNFVVAHLTVSESDTVKHPNTPGAQALMDQYYGAGLGIPYWLVFDKDGKLLADSKIRKPGEPLSAGDNIGCPATAEEVDAFIAILSKTSELSASQAEAIRKRFRENEH